MFSLFSCHVLYKIFKESSVANGPSESAESALLMNVYRGLAILVSSGILVPLINLLLKARFFGLLQGRELLLEVLCMVLWLLGCWTFN